MIVVNKLKREHTENTVLNRAGVITSFIYKYLRTRLWFL